MCGAPKSQQRGWSTCTPSRVHIPDVLSATRKLARNRLREDSLLIFDRCPQSRLAVTNLNKRSALLADNPFFGAVESQLVIFDISPRHSVQSRHVLAQDVSHLCRHRPSFVIRGSFRPQQLINGYEPKWWKEAVVYQVYPRSFKDSNGDGIGDLPGITSKLDYLQKLGVNVIWLSPHFDSPNADNGYDIRDYRKVMKEFGTMADFDAMLAGIKQRHMRLIIDLVGQPHQDEHTGSSRAASLRTIPTVTTISGGPANTGADGKADTAQQLSVILLRLRLAVRPTTKEYYLHYFAVKQPDLNWDNPKVREEIYGMMRFWLDKGVDGFRMDVIPLISKPTGFPTSPPKQLKRPHEVYANGPHMHEYLQRDEPRGPFEVRRHVRRRSAGITLAQTHSLVDDDRHELNMIFNFDAVRSVNRDSAKHSEELDAARSSRPSTRIMRRYSASMTGTRSSSPTTTIRASSPASATTRRNPRAFREAARDHDPDLARHALPLPGRRAGHDQLSLQKA